MDASEKETETGGDPYRCRTKIWWFRYNLVGIQSHIIDNIRFWKK